MRLYFALILIFNAMHLPMLLAQQKEFQRTIGGSKKETAFQVIETSDKGNITVGSTMSIGAGKSDIYIVKTDSVGNLKWAKTYGGPHDDFGQSIDRTQDGNYVVVGYSLSFAKDYNDICLIKIDNEGNILWGKSYPLEKSDYSNAVASTKDGGAIIIGETITFKNQVKNADILVLKTDKDGKVSWSKVFGGDSTDYAYSIQETSEGGYILAGETKSYGAGDWDFYLLKLSKDGNVEWSRTLGDVKSDGARSITETEDGGFLVGGNTYNFKAVESDVCIAKLKKEGDVEWAKTYGGLETDYLLSIKSLNKDRFAICGFSNSFGLKYEDAFVMLLKGNGKPIWSKAFGSDTSDYGVNICFTSDHHIVMCGTSKGFKTTEDDIYLIKTGMTWKVEGCNMSNMYPMQIENVLFKSGTGHNVVPISCTEIQVEVMSMDVTGYASPQDLCPILEP